MLEKLRNNQGSALPTVIIIIIVISLFILALTNYALADFRQKVYQNRKIQAYYLAKTGAESTLHAWIEEGYYTDTSDSEESVDRVYLDTDYNEFVNEEPEEYVGYFDVKIIIKNGETKIVSVGYCQGVTVEVVVIIDTNRYIYWID